MWSGWDLRRKKHALVFFWCGMVLSCALIGGGWVLLAQQRAAPGAIMDGAGFLLLVTVLVRRIVDLSRYPRYRPPPGERTVKILMAGYSGSGKTMMLASLYHHFFVGTPGGIRFYTDDESNRILVGLADAIRDHRKPLPTGTQETRRWKFTVRVESSGGQKSDAFTLEYLDYAGGHIDRMLARQDPSVVPELDPVLKAELESTDVLMGVLDGELLARLMPGGFDAGIVGDIECLLYILIRTGHRNIHLVITKWDSMLGPGGRHYTVAEVRRRLAEVSGAFRRFQRNPRLEASMRIIPVAALGVNGFASYDPALGGSTARQAGIPWEPFNVEVPFFSAVPDILASDVPELARRPAGTLSKIGLAVFSIARLIEVHVPLGPIDLKVPVEEVIQKVRDFAREGNQRGRAPASLTAESALRYVLNESYAALDEFERGTPGSRVTQPGAHG